jgi:hypothetical protein
MSRRPGPKPNLDPNYIGALFGINEKQLELTEQLMGHMANQNPDQRTTQLLQELDRLNQQVADLREYHGFHLCDICKKSFCDAKGVRRHILTMGDEAHQARMLQLTSLVCRYCERNFKKRESVTKHENVCPTSEL